MSIDFYILYDKISLRVLSLSGTKFENLKEGQAIIKVKEKDVMPFFNGEDDIGTWSLDVSEEYATFYKKNWELRNSRSYSNRESKNSIVSNEYVNDLSYKTFFFDYFKISYSKTELGLDLLFDLDQLSGNQLKQFKSMITSDNGNSVLFVSRLGDPTNLVYSKDFNLNDFKTTKSITLDVCLPEGEFSLWASRF